jgi:2-oxoglutarate ferredoxin oxidoreductase subunit delta
MAKNRFKAQKERCKGCALCVSVCPLGLLTMSKDVNNKGTRYVTLTDPEKCTGCGLCYTVCPECCIEIKETGTK